MQQIVRDGIEIDRCPVSGGVWLDRGELEKLLAAVQRVAVEERQEYASYRQEHPSNYARPQNHNQSQSRERYDDDDDYEDYNRKKYGKKSKMSSLLSMFD
jgi:Zn-finger nucleic acid-binding protein